MSDPSHKPLISFLIFAYNQERFIREAVEGALSQTYSPLEIILSDDCSSDSTFEVMKQAAASYRGSHKIILNRNSRNLGLGGHVNRVVELARGELLIGAAGDDISLPGRTSKTAQVWEDSGRRATSIHGAWIGIDENGKPTKEEVYQDWPQTNAPVQRQSQPPSEIVGTLRPLLHGSTHAFAKRLFTTFGPLPANAVYEDKALHFRSSLIGEVHFIREPLVRYRRHSENTFAPLSLSSVSSLDQFPALDRQLAREFERHIAVYDCFRADVSTLLSRGMLSAQDTAILHAQIAQARRGCELRREILNKGFVQRIWIAAKMVKDGYNIRRLLPRLWPKPVFMAYILTWGRLRQFKRQKA